MASVQSSARHWNATPFVMVLVGGAMVALAALCLPMLSIWRATMLPPLHAAAESGDLARIKDTLDDGADPNQRVQSSWGQVYDGMTPLMLAASTGQADAIRLLIERGADAAMVDPHGRSAADFAALSGSDEAIALLKQAPRNDDTSSVR